MLAKCARNRKGPSYGSKVERWWLTSDSLYGRDSKIVGGFARLQIADGKRRREIGFRMSWMMCTAV